MDGVLYVENTHLTFATATKGRNAYISAIDLRKRKLLRRSPALVANARGFVLDGDYIVPGYGFTAEPDFLYLLDRRTGKVLDRLPVPSAPEAISCTAIACTCARTTTTSSLASWAGSRLQQTVASVA